MRNGKSNTDTDLLVKEDTRRESESPSAYAKTNSLRWESLVKKMGSERDWLQARE